MLKIYYADISSLNPYAEYELFSDYRLEKLTKLKHSESRKQGIGAELLLLYAVRENSTLSGFPLHIKVNKYSKPFCDELPFKFSISHSGRFSAVAVSERELGLDIQKISAFNEALSAGRFSEAEREYIEQSKDPDRAFTEIWSMKESYLKALGTGLHTPLSSFSVMPDRKIDAYHIASAALEDCIFSLCTCNSSEKPEIIKIKL